jgi:hypothetical protein
MARFHPGAKEGREKNTIIRRSCVRPESNGVFRSKIDFREIGTDAHHVLGRCILSLFRPPIDDSFWTDFQDDLDFGRPASVAARLHIALCVPDLLPPKKAPS